jgi:hypothetical protein
MGCLTRVISAWIQYDLSLISLLFCKIRIYFVLTALPISRYLLCLISIDRWMITSRNTAIRKQSSPKGARRLILGGVLFLITVSVYIPVGYVIDKNLGCGPSTDPVYSLFYTIYNIILTLTPLLTLIIFSVLILINIRHIGHRQVYPITQLSLNHEIPNQRRRYQKKDIQYIKLSLTQVAGYILFNTLHGYNTIYAIVIRKTTKTADQRAIEIFVYGIGLNLHYTYTGVNLFFLLIR